MLKRLNMLLLLLLLLLQNLQLLTQNRIGSRVPQKNFVPLVRL
jgi:hypothetical protein